MIMRLVWRHPHKALWLLGAVPVVMLCLADQAQASFMPLYQVAMNPRCTNCHVSDDRPRQTDDRVIHIMNVQGRLRDLGQKCSSCHGEKNLKEPHLPPGAVGWDLPPPELAFKADMDPFALCMQWKNRMTNGDRSLPELVNHFETDHLVRWTWLPGPGRTPSPGSHKEFVAAAQTWLKAGAPCPEESKDWMKRDAQFSTNLSESIGGW